MRIGILGGTFDPPHVGHLALARAAQTQLELDEVLFLPAARNPLKPRSSRTDGKHRLEMVRRLVQNEDRMAVSDMELTRGGVSYTVDTLGELHMVQPADYWFILGADALRGFGEWKSPHRLLRLCRLAVAVRPPMSPQDALVRLPEEYREKVDIVSMPPMAMSSTEIRERLARGKGTLDWVPETVLRYIQTNKLYRE
ncbi:MAG TPA: nicotinate-nucleotide adenylyltransferase [Fimbriimonas sp.]